MQDDFVSANATSEGLLDIPAALRICSFSATYSKIVTTLRTTLMLQHTVIHELFVMAACLQQHLSLTILGLS